MSFLYQSNFVKGFSHEEKIQKMHYLPFGKTGLNISKISLGSAAFGGSHTYGDFKKDEAAETVIQSVRCGINFIDSGVHYGEGLAETFLGPVLKKIPREAFMISTKVGRCGNKFDFTPKSVTESFEQSLKRLELEFVHDIEFSNSLDFILNVTLPAVYEFVKAGKAKFIGLSGYPLSVLWETVKRSKIKIDCVLSYCRDILTDNSLQDFLPLFEKEGVAVINGGCIGMRLLSNAGPPAWHPASQELKELCRQAAEYCVEQGVELGELALYFSLNQPGCFTCLVGMNDRSTLESNLRIFWDGLNEKQKEVFQYVKEKFFKFNMQCHWEGLELELHRKNLL